MNVNDLANRIAGEYNLSANRSRRIVSEVFEEIKRFVEDGGRVTIRRFGAFQLVHRGAREGKNFHTGEKVKIPARRVWKFTAPRWKR